MFSLILLCLFWLPCAALSLVMMLLTMCLAPILALCALRKTHDMPWFLAWFGQWDDNLRASREGENWTNKRYTQWIRAHLPGKFGQWLEAMLWIMRNPSQYFDYWFTGQSIKPGWNNDGSVKPFSFTVYGKPDINDQTGKTGWCLCLLNTGDRQIPNFRLVFKWPCIKRYGQLWLGWQFPGKLEEIAPNSCAQLKVTFNL